MKKPTFNLYKPFSFDYQEHKEDTRIYESFIPLHEDYDTDICHLCHIEIANCECSNDNSEIKYAPLNEMSLQKLIDLVPQDVELEDVKIKTYFDSGDYPTGLFVNFYYTKNMPARPEELIKDTEQYEIELAKYEDEMKVYEAWEKQEEIKELEAKLAKLKKIK